MARRPRDVPYSIELENAIAELVGTALDVFSENLHGNAVWTPRSLISLSVLMSWSEGQTLASRFEASRELLAVMRPDQELPASYTGYAKALARHIPAMISALRPRFRDQLRKRAGPHWRVGGWVVFAADGSRFEAPRTVANEQTLKCAGKRRTAPQVSHTMLIHLGTNAIWDFRCGPGVDSERRHLEEMSRDLPEGSLVTADAGFAGSPLCRRLLAAGTNFLLRVGGNITLLADHATSVEQRGGAVWLWPQDRRSSPPLVLRLIRLNQRGKSLFLVTNVPETQLSRSLAREIYRRRWGIEVCYRSIKQTLDRGDWLSRTPDRVLAEHQSTIVGFWLLQLARLEPPRRSGDDPRRWSVARARDATRRVMRQALQPPRPGQIPWRTQLAAARQDDYVRRQPKTARDWPHKKREPPPKPPCLVKLSQQIRQRGKVLLKN